MATRTIYLCDWCDVESPKPGYVGEAWKQIESPDVTRTLEWLCERCFAHYKVAVAYARDERRGNAQAVVIVSPVGACDGSGITEVGEECKGCRACS